MSSQNFSNSNSLKFHLSGNTESISKQPTQLIVQLNLSLWHIIVTLLLSSEYTIPKLKVDRRAVLFNYCYPE